MIAEKFLREGCIVVPSFASKAECDEMKHRMKELVGAWDGKCECVFHAERTGQKSDQSSNDYFFSSADKIHFFLEPNAVDPKSGNIVPGLDKLSSINKVGHGLHYHDPVFSKYSFSEKVKKLVHSLGYRDPVLPQSMYIMKNAKVGGEVTSHQDSTFLFTYPKLSCLGLWLALDDATLENGCLWARLGSHKLPLVNRWKRSESKGPNGEIQMEFEQFLEEEDVKRLTPLFGKSLVDFSAEQLKAQGYTPLPCKAGDLVLIHGEVDHLSLPNKSDKARHTYQLHLVEGPRNGVHWDPSNWLQLPPGSKFPSLNVSPSAKL